MVPLLLLILLIPSQLSLHLWPSWSLINGIRVDYLSPTLYLTDLIIVGLFLTSRFRIRIPLFVIIFVVLNILIARYTISSSPLVSLYKWLRVYEYFWLLKYLALKIDWKSKLVNWSFTLAIIWTAFLTWAQFLRQSSVGGLWYWLGERSFNISTPGIAKIFIPNLGLVLRPYATLPHPNALAGFLLMTSLILYSLRRNHPSRFLDISLFVSLLTLPLTFSRSALLVEISLIIFWLIKKLNKLFLVLFIVPLILYFYLPSSPNSIPERILLNQQAFATIKQFPIFGIGLGNSVSLLPSLRQPVHNIYLLLASELGLPAVLIIGYCVFKICLRFRNSILEIPLLVVLATGLVDHYWLTLHSTTLLLVVLLSLIKVKSADV